MFIHGVEFPEISWSVWNKYLCVRVCVYMCVFNCQWNIEYLHLYASNSDCFPGYYWSVLLNNVQRLNE